MIVKKVKYILIVLSACYSIALIGQTKKQCGFTSIYEETSTNLEFNSYQSKFERFLKDYKTDKTDTIIRIPVVFHIVYRTGEENIWDEQIQTQLDVLNEDFRRKNADVTNANGFSTADVKIEFCYAKKTPDGDFTTGITRTQTNIDNIGTTQEYYKVAPIWDRERYINIWVCDNDANNPNNSLGVIGFAFPPGRSTPSNEGILIDYTAFGTIRTAIPPTDKGRTATHEMGHMLSLLHIWGSSRECGSSDLVDDTPEQRREIYDCPISNFSCESKDMLSNFLGYIDDKCMGNFTEGQKTRMRAAIEFGRPGWATDDECWPVGIRENELQNKVSIFPNPSLGNFQLTFSDDFLGEDVNLILMDLLGKEHRIQTKRISNGFEISTDRVQGNGIYFLQIKSNQYEIQKKVILFNTLK